MDSQKYWHLVVSTKWSGLLVDSKEQTLEKEQGDEEHYPLDKKTSTYFREKSKGGTNSKSAIIPQITKDYLTGHLLTKLVPSVYTLVICVALPLNVTAIIIFIFRVKVMKPAVVYMLNLAIADVLFVISLPFIITYRFSGNDWLLGEGMCRIVTAAFYCNMYCSILLMTSISVDRFLAVVYPIRSLHWRTTTRAWVVCIFVWILSISSNVPLFLTRQTYFIGNLNTTTCHDVQSMELRNFHLYYDTTFISIFFFLPFIVTTFCYIGVIRKISSLGSGSKLKKSRAVVLTVTVLCVFVICFGPTHIILLIHTFGYNDIDNGFLYFAYVICACISSISCCIDPLIYYYGSLKCQEHLHNLLCCKMNSGSEGSTLLALTK
ncbi:proteinase-activated receptor 1-like [Engystomops pustulosus]|uniref:proteinase-activated receptor 1-like n=1 Tax=Engystomops pustulosus TaxID=76066 RepID=UPI003AFA0CDD